MHPISATHDWIASHPVAFPLALFVLAIPFSIYANDIKEFLKVPPQRFGTWILKARINATTLRVARISRIRQEPAYAMFRLFMSIMFVLGVILVFAAASYSSVAFPKEPLLVHEDWIQIVLFFGPFAVLLQTIRDFNSAVGDRDPLPGMKQKIERLKTKLSSA